MRPHAVCSERWIVNKAGSGLAWPTVADQACNRDLKGRDRSDWIAVKEPLRWICCSRMRWASLELALSDIPPMFDVYRHFPKRCLSHIELFIDRPDGLVETLRATKGPDSLEGALKPRYNHRYVRVIFV